MIMKLPDTETIKKIDYLRISVTDRCNLRCTYCMPKGGIIPQPQDRILTFEEIVRLARVFVSAGIRKIRLTGGEPLLRRGIVDLVKRLNHIEGIDELCITTNGLLFTPYADVLRKTGIKKINISLDTLKEERFRSITGSNRLDLVLESIQKAKDLGFDPIKMNVAVMREVNDDEILDFAKFAFAEGLMVRFIEFMKVTPLWKEHLFMPIEEIKDVCHTAYGLQKVAYKSSGPAEYYRCNGGIVGFIKTSKKNCKLCSRLRLTSTGELKSCLYQPQGVSLRRLLRKGVEDTYLKDTIQSTMNLKGDIDYQKWAQKPDVFMCSVGG